MEQGLEAALSRTPPTEPQYRTLDGAQEAQLDQRAQDIPFTTQTRLHFDVILPLWGRRGPQ